MTKVLLVCNKEGAFKSCRAEGHASYAEKGKDIVCAAESFLLRTAIDVLEKTEGITLKLDKSLHGTLAFCVEEHVFLDNRQAFLLQERLKCTADFIRMGFKSLSEEYPEKVQLREISEE